MADRAPVFAALTAILALVVAAPARASDKTDIVDLINGDHLTGEIKGMSLGKLDFKTDDAGRLSIEWLKVARMVSVHAFEVELDSGEKYYGPLLLPPMEGALVVGREGEDVLPVASVITVTPMDDAFWSRVRAYLDLGFTLAKANTAMTLSGDGEFAYRGQHFGGKLEFNNYVQTDTNSTLVSQYSVLLTGTYFFTKWRALVTAGADHNDELALDLRLSVGGGASYPILRNTANEIWLTGALVGDREQYANGSPNLNLALYFGGEWEAFRYDSPKLDSDLTANILPVLNNLGRFRGNVSYRIKYEIFADFNLGVRFSFTYDTKPPDTTASHTDYLVSLTIGWSFHQ